MVPAVSRPAPGDTAAASLMKRFQLKLAAQKNESPRTAAKNSAKVSSLPHPRGGAMKPANTSKAPAAVVSQKEKALPRVRLVAEEHAPAHRGVHFYPHLPQRKNC